MYTTRRGFLGLGVTALLNAVFHPKLVGTAVSDVLPPHHRDRAGALLGLLGSRDSAARIGQRYLARHPHQPDAETLLDEFLTAAPAVRDALQTGSVKVLQQAVFSQYQDDYRQGRTVSINGWIFSATEARVCAIAACVQPGI